MLGYHAIIANFMLHIPHDCCSKKKKETRACCKLQFENILYSVSLL
uniref:Uncharacterized protein n=1 Tax=Arundo donax TaxID=35708 RepID=A0A0A9BSJ7_ARUDO